MHLYSTWSRVQVLCLRDPTLVILPINIFLYCLKQKTMDWVTQTTSIHSLEGWSPRLGSKMLECLVQALLIHRELPSPVIPTWWRGKALVSLSPYKGTNTIKWVLLSWLHLILIISQRSYVQIHWGLRFQHMNFGKTNIQSIAPTIFDGYTTVRKKPLLIRHPFSFSKAFLSLVKLYWNFQEIQLSKKFNQCTWQL